MGYSLAGNNKTILVLAGNHVEYYRWCRQNRIDPHVGRSSVYVNGPNSIFGLHIPGDARVVRIGTYANRHDLPHIEEWLKMITDSEYDDQPRIDFPEML